METQPDVVAAAEAVRTWVRAQRSTWASPATLPTSRAASPISFAPPAWPAAPALVRPRPDSSAEFWPTDLGATSLADAEASFVAPAASMPAIPTVASPSLAASLEAPTPFSSRGWVRAAAALVLVGALAGGGLVGWRRLNSGVRVGTVAFESLPPGSQVVVDGNPVGQTPVAVELAAGPHAVEFRTKSARRSQRVVVVRGQRTAFTLDWNARRFGGLQVTSTPAEAKVLIDGRERGVTPLSLTDLLVGAHAVQIESSEGTVKRHVEIVEGRTETLDESIYPGWLHVSADIDVTVVDGTHAVQLDDSNRVLLKPGAHNLRIENGPLGFSVTRQVDVEPGGTAEVTVEVPPSTLTVTGTAGAEVFVDGVKAGSIPLSDYQVKLGTRDIMVVAPGGETRHASVRVTTKPAQLDVSFHRP